MKDVKMTFLVGVLSVMRKSAKGENNDLPEVDHDF